MANNGINVALLGSTGLVVSYPVIRYIKFQPYLTS